MKRIILLTAMLIGGLVTLQAQTTKGTFSLGLHNFSPLSGTALIAPTNSFGLAFGKMTSESPFGMEDTEVKYTNVGLNGNFHYFVVDHFAIGLNLNLLSQTNKEQTGDKAKSTLLLFLAGPELSYFIPVGGKVNVYIKGGGSFGTSKIEYNGENDEDPTKLTQFGGGAGLAVFPNPHVSIDFGAGYDGFITKDTYTDFGGDKNEYKDTVGGVTIDFGFTVYF